MGKFNNNLIDANTDSTGDEDQILNRVKNRFKKIAATIGLKDTVMSLNNWLWSGSNLKQQTLEIEENMRELITEGKYGYKYIENYLMSVGYPLKEIREVFKRLTGVSVEDWMNVEFHTSNVPGTIPTISYGWGEAKGKEYDYYFVMPWNLGYEIFGQKGDLQRDECFYHRTLEEAREKLDKIVKEAYYWDKPVSVKQLKEFPKQNLTEPIPFHVSASEEFNKLDDYLYENSDTLSKEDMNNVLTKSLQANKITHPEYVELAKNYILKQSDELDKQSSMQTIIKEKGKEYKVITQYYPGTQGLYVAVYDNKTNRIVDQFGLQVKGPEDEAKYHEDLKKGKKSSLNKQSGPDIEKMNPEGEEDKKEMLREKVFELEKEELSKPFEEELKEVTPKDFFEKRKDIKYEIIPADIVDKTLRYIKEKNETFQDFEIIVQSFKYTSVELVEKMEQTVSVPEQVQDEFFSANALVSVLLKLRDVTLPSPKNEKMGLMIFLVIDNDIVSSDIITGEDNEKYSLSEEGLSRYFFNERSDAESI